MILRQMARSTSSKLWKTSNRNALFTSTSMPPNSSVAGRHQAGAGLGVDDVGRHGDGTGPEPATSARTSSRVDWRRAASTRSAPCAASARAAWRPRPGPTPDTTHTLPDSNPAAGRRALLRSRSRHGRSVGQRRLGVAAIRAGVTRA